MSIRAMNWAWEQVLEPTPKLILMALADCANDFDECWPSIRLIAKKCCVSERTVQRTLQKFTQNNLIIVSSRHTQSGRQSSNEYRLLLSRKSTPDNLSPHLETELTSVDNLSPSGVTSGVTLGGVTTMSPLEPPRESSQQPLHFPSGLTTMEKSFVSNLVQNLDDQIAQALIDELADAIESGTIRKNLLRWFNALVEKQKLGAFMPTGGIRIKDRRNARVLERQTILEKKELKTLPTDSKAAREAIAKLKRTIKTPNGDKS
ncbi:helix-turn-helix domain-containing protein [Undibacterium sp. Ji22W]|uniref:helix-turn-helix domain-containing protein n=1 Tax=Undibacterium sp. Ji22W TaxID=3413038 RepID=UPI003BF2A211